MDDSIDSGQVTKFCSITVTDFHYSCFTVRVCVSIMSHCKGFFHLEDV